MPSDLERAAREVDKLTSIATHSPYWKPETAEELSKLADRIRGLADQETPMTNTAHNTAIEAALSIAETMPALNAQSVQPGTEYRQAARDIATAISALLKPENTDAC